MNRRYTFLTVFLATLLFSGIINAQVLFNFSDATYTAATNLTSQNGWVMTGTATATPLQVIASTMSYPTLPYGVGPSAVQVNTSGEDNNHPFTAVTSGSVYCSFLIKVSAVPTVGSNADYFIHFGDGTSTNFWARTLIRASATNVFDFGISKAATTTSTPAYTNQVLALNTTYHVVIKYTFNTGSTTDDEADLFLNPVLNGTEPAVPTASALISTATDPLTISTINLRQGSTATSSTLQVSDIRVGLTWADAPMPVELTSFTAAVSNNAVNLKWSTATELRNSGFAVERSANNSDWTKLGFVGGKGNSNSVNKYSYTDKSIASSGKYYYRLKQIDNDGSYKYSNTTEADFTAPSVYSLNQNYPNPFNPSTTIAYSIPKASNVKLSVYNAIGQVVSVLEDGFKEAGVYSVSFNASNLTSGLYFYKIEAGQFSQIRKMMLVK